MSDESQTAVTSSINTDDPTPKFDNVAAIKPATTPPDVNDDKQETIREQETKETEKQNEVEGSSQPETNVVQGIETLTLSKPHESKEKDKEDLNSESKSNLIINYLPPSMTEGALATLFSPYGAMENCKIVVDVETARSRGFGFVKFTTDDGATRAMKALNGYSCNGKKLKVAYARPKCKEIQNANLYVTGLPHHYNNVMLKDLFLGYGTIIECRVLQEPNGECKGVGFVRLDTHSNAIKAINDKDGTIPPQGDGRITVKLAQRHASPRRGRSFWSRGSSFSPRRGQGHDSPRRGNARNNPNRSDQKNFRGRGRSRGRGRRQKSLRRSPRYDRDPLNGAGMYLTHQYPQEVGNVFTYPTGTAPSLAQPMNPGFPTQVSTQTVYDYGYAGYNQQYTYAQPQAKHSITNPTAFSDPQSRSKTFTVYVDNMPPHFTADHLIKIYARYGPSSAKLIPNAHGIGKHIGVVTFFYFEDAQRATRETHGKREENQRLEVHFAPDSRLV